MPYFERHPDILAAIRGGLLIGPVGNTGASVLTLHGGDTALGASLSRGLKNEYSRVQAWNADESRILIRGVGASWYLYDAASLDGHLELARGRREQAGEHLEEGALAGAVASRDQDERALRDVEIQLLYRPAQDRLDLARLATITGNEENLIDHRWLETDNARSRTAAARNAPPRGGRRCPTAKDQSGTLESA